MEINLESLSWFNSPEEQKAAIAKISEQVDVSWQGLIMPHRKQHCWENCALVLAKQSDDTLATILAPLMEWFQDLNWPGAIIISERLKQLPVLMLKPAYLDALSEAKITNDTSWDEFLKMEFGYLDAL